MKKRNTLDMTQGSITPLLIRFSIPLILNKVLDICYNMADKAMLGRFVGDDAMAAAGVTNAPFNLLYNLIAGFALGALVCCGNYLGARDQKGLSKCMHTSLAVGVLLGVVLMVLGLVFSRPLLVLVQTPPELLEDALVYFRIRFAYTCFLVCSTFESNIMIAHGDSKRITLANSVGGITNVVLNFVFLKIFSLGVAGVALATFLSHLLVFIWKTVWLFDQKGEYRLRFSQLRVDAVHAKNVLGVGIPNGLNSTMFSISNILLQSSVNSFGPLYITANTCADAVADFVNIAYAGFPSACVAAVSQCYGARNFARMKQVMKKSFLLMQTGIVVLDVVVMLFARPLLGLFTKTPEVVDAGIYKLTFYCIGYLVYTFLQVYMAGLKGIKKSMLSLIANGVGVCLPRILWVALVMPHFHDPNMLYAIYPISWLIASITLGIAFHTSYRKLSKAAIPKPQNSPQ